MLCSSAWTRDWTGRVKYDVEYSGCGVRQLMLCSSAWTRAWTYRVKYDVEYAGCGVRQLMLCSSAWTRAWTCFRFRSEKSFQVAGSILLLSLFTPAQPL